MIVVPVGLKAPPDTVGAGPQFRSKVVEIVSVVAPAFVKPVAGCLNRGTVTLLLEVVNVFEVPVIVSQPVPVQTKGAIPV